MTPVIIALLFLTAAVTFARWRRFSAIQWIWLLAGAAVFIVIAWFAVVVFIVGPEMQRTIPGTFGR